MLKASILCPSWQKTGKLDKIVMYLAKGQSKRDIGTKLRVDRSLISTVFHIKAKKAVTYAYAQKVVDAVLRRKLGYDAVVKQWGARGLQALGTYLDLYLAHQRKVAAKQCNELRGGLESPSAPLRSISLRTGLSSETVRNYLNAYHKTTQIGNVRTHSSKKTAELATQLFRGGRTIPEIAAILRRTSMAVRCILNQSGVRMRKPMLLTAADVKVIATLRKQSVPWRTIATIYCAPMRRLLHAYNSLQFDTINSEGANVR